MTVHLSSPRAKPRWLALTLIVLAVSAIAVGFATAHGATTLPAGYVGSAQEDVHGGNDVPGQVDVTQMGRDNTEAPNLRIFWGWDSISAWTGSGQTGDACALFDDNDGDAFIDYVVCARVQNINANPDNVGILVAATNKPVFIFDCSNKKNDRCTNPVPRTYGVGDVVAGPLGSLSTSGAGNLISETDPFSADDLGGPGESYPHDSTIDIRIDDSLVPSSVALVNVCSYPSAGNGGNNNPFDCIVTPGTQYGTLRIVKVITQNNGVNAAFGNFSYSVNGGTAVAFDADGITESQVPTGNYTVTEPSVTGWTTTYANNVNANTNCNSIAVSVGATTTCTITNTDNAPSLTLVKNLSQNNGATDLASAWTLRANKSDTDTTTYELSGSTPASSDAGFDIGTYNLSETGPGGYTASAWSCVKNGGAPVEGSSITLGLGDSATCTITNSDNAPSLTLIKELNENNDGPAVATDWTLRANKSGTDTTAYELTGTTPVASDAGFDVGTYDLSETGPGGYTPSAWSCVKNGGAPVDGSSITLGLGDSATCTITNSDNAPSLTLVKEIVNNSGGQASATDWTLRANKSGTDTTVYELTGTTPVASDAGFDIGTYDLSETGPGGYTPSAWSCVKNGGAPVEGSSITLALGDSATCTITNDDNIASPEIGTTMTWTLHDAAALTGFVSGGGVSTITFTLYKDTTTLDSCEESTEVDSETVNVNDATGTASTTTGFLVTEPGTYRWIASFSGNTYNAAIDSDCGDEVTVITSSEE